MNTNSTTKEKVFENLIGPSGDHSEIHDIDQGALRKIDPDGELKEILGPEIRALTPKGRVIFARKLERLARELRKSAKALKVISLFNKGLSFNPNSRN